MPEELAELLTLYAFETDVFHKTDKDAVLEIDILPNRFSDAASHFGVAREIQTVFAIVKNQKLALKNPELKDLGQSKHSLKITVEDKALCPRYSAALIEGVKVGPSPKWMQDKLASCGVGAINNIVDVTNFVMLEMGQPIHAFDFEKVTEKEINIRRAMPQEEIVLLDGRKVELDQNILVISDKNSPLALAGIKGGKAAEINKDTKTILLEAASFDKKRTFITSKKLRIDSDAARRFSNSVNEETVIDALKRAVYLIEKEAEGKLVDWADVNALEIKPRKIKLDLTKVNDLIGNTIPSVSINNILLSINCQVEFLSENELMVLVPYYRKDLNLAEDLIEEVARLVGYNELKAQLPYLPLAPVDPQIEEIYYEKLKEILQGAGFAEAYNYSLISEQWLKTIGDNEKDHWVLLKNPISERFAVLRPNIPAGLLMNIKENLKYEKDIRLFEMGKVFEKTEEKIGEKSQLGIVLCLPRDALFELKGIIELLLKALGIEDVWFEAQEDAKEISAKPEVKFSQEHAAYIKIENHLVGGLSVASPELLDKIETESEITIAWLDLEKLLTFARKEHQYVSPSKYPGVFRDLAILVEKSVRFSEIVDIMKNAGSKIVQDVDLFDIYEGKNLPANTRSLAFHIVYQSKDHTLDDQEVNDNHHKIEQALKEKLDAKIR